MGLCLAALLAAAAQLQVGQEKPRSNPP